jgi:hypothetical protein
MARWMAIGGALGVGAFGVLGAVGCSRTDPLDYELLGPPDASSDTGAPDTGRDVERPRDVLVRDVPEVGPPDVEQDVPEAGCRRDAECDDGIACTRDRCDRLTGACIHAPVDSRCPEGDACFVMTGCQPGSFADSRTTLYQVTLPSAADDAIEDTGLSYDDIALSLDGTLYGVTQGGLYTIATTTGVSALVASVDRALNALDFGPDGTLYAAASATTEIYTVDPTTGVLTVIANFPEPYSSSGDVAVMDTTLFATATTGVTGSPDLLVAVDLTTTPVAVSIVGTTGQACIWGLAARERVLYGFTCLGDVLAIDTSTGAAEIITANVGQTFIGAASR